MPHNELLLKLKRLGVSGDLWLWLLSLTSINVSAWMTVILSFCRLSLEFPRGASLALFSSFVYVNDLPETVRHSMLLMFADDAKCAKLIRGPLDCVHLQEDLDYFVG